MYVHFNIEPRVAETIRPAADCRARVTGRVGRMYPVATALPFVYSVNECTFISPRPARAPVPPGHGQAAAPAKRGPRSAAMNDSRSEWAAPMRLGPWGVAPRPGIDPKTRGFGHHEIPLVPGRRSTAVAKYPRRGSIWARRDRTFDDITVTCGAGPGPPGKARGPGTGRARSVRDGRRPVSGGGSLPCWLRSTT